MTMMLMFMIIILSICPLFLSHPLSMGLNLLMQTILIAMISGIMSMNFWISYLLFLVMVGGMLILFMYMTSIASNEKFYFSKYLIILIPFMALILIIGLMNQNLIIKNLDSMEYLNFSMYEMSPNKYFINNSKYILSMLIIYLFITLIAIVNISSNNFGPLRQKF
uniref:NADH-ubiquinone oxidoreductase chain 6 n=1 Tax=Lycocerus asperipennis TaxID=2806094 RepID=A0A7U1BEI2_9COLE|nr:NADH dehydrogenase subunit 6 [Lycocerus asperipennis]QQY97884.1 NADH dehydrogenase subunit 6 [Lycocerus asperipennis]